MENYQLTLHTEAISYAHIRARDRASPSTGCRKRNKYIPNMTQGRKKLPRQAKLHASMLPWSSPWRVLLQCVFTNNELQWVMVADRATRSLKSTHCIIAIANAYTATVDVCPICWPQVKDEANHPTAKGRDIGTAQSRMTRRPPDVVPRSCQRTDVNSREIFIIGQHERSGKLKKNWTEQ